MKDPPSYLVFSKIRVLSWSAAGEAYFNTIRKLAINAVRTGEFSALPHVISQERRMIWVCGVISNHIPPGNAYCSTHCPTQSYAHTFLMHSCPQSIPTKLLICRSNCSHFSSRIQVSIIAFNRFRSEDDRLRESFPETAKIFSKYTHLRKRFLFFYSVLLHCQSSVRPSIAACAVVRSSM